MADGPLYGLILSLRGLHVILDSDLARLYGTTTKVLNQAVKRNGGRFPPDFMFQLDEAEKGGVVTDCDRFAQLKHSSQRPYAFTEQGVAMLSGVLKSAKAVEVNIQVMRAFVAMRRFLLGNAELFSRIGRAEQKLLVHDKKLDELFRLIAPKQLPEKGIFYDGQVFDAYAFVSGLVKGAQRSIVLIDPYVDESVLVLFSKAGVPVTIYTHLTRQVALDVERFNAQYGGVTLKGFTRSHDRFLIIDDDVYHFGASLKDLGKKWFAFSRFGKGAVKMLERV